MLGMIFLSLSILWFLNRLYAVSRFNLLYLWYSWLMKKLKSPYSKKVYENTAELFEAMASPKRLEILNLLKNQDLSVTEIAKAMGIRVANVSQHLMALRYLKFVTRKGTGKSVTYKIAKPEILEPFIVFHKLIKKG